MSEKERFDWDDDLDFESLADEQATQEESMEDLADFGDESQVSPPEIDVNVSTGTPGKVSDQSTGLGLSAGGLGFLFAISTLVSGLGLAGAVLFVGKIDPLILWNPQGLMQVDQWFNFQQYPLNLLYILVVGVMALGFLGSWAVARAVSSAKARHVAATGVLEQITELRLDNEEAWQHNSLKSDPKIAAFVAETLGSWRLQMARQKKNTGLEGELNRLQKAMKNKSRDDMVGRYDNPYAGDLADSAVQLFDESEAARNEAKGARSKDQHQSEEIINIVQDARSWNRSAREKLGAQGVTVEKLSSQLSQLSQWVDQMAGNDESSKISAAITDISRDVSSWSAESGLGNDLVQMNELVDRGSKLAFQIAMEVARLGTRGERLLPMTQALEELTNEFRQLTKALGENNKSETQDRIKNRLQQVQARLDQDQGQDSAKLKEVTGQLIPAAAQVSREMVDASQTFSQQADRLTQLGETLANFTGAAFNSEDISMGNPDNPPEGGLNLTQHDPFANGSELKESVTDVDPFSQSDNLLTGGTETPEDSGFMTSVTPGQDDGYGEPETLLSTPEEKVYDLGEFGAVRVDEPQTAGADEEEVFDLAEFGAVTLT